MLEAGSFAMVCAASTEDGTRWAIKVLQKAHAVKVKQVDNVQRMIDLTPRFDHPHLIRCEQPAAQDSLRVYQVRNSTIATRPQASVTRGVDLAAPSVLTTPDISG